MCSIIFEYILSRYAIKSWVLHKIVVKAPMHSFLASKSYSTNPRAYKNETVCIGTTDTDPFKWAIQPFGCT